MIDSYSSIRSAAMLLALAATAVACAKQPDNTESSAEVLAATGNPDSARVMNRNESAAGSERVAMIDGFKTPESVRWDADQQVWFVSNIDGNPSAKDGNGFIARLGVDGKVDSMHFIQGGRGGAMLHAPKGMALKGDTLAIADIDALRFFDRRTGASLGSVNLPQAVFANDVALGGDGAWYITDTGIRFGAGGMTKPGRDRLFRVSGRKATQLLVSDSLGAPNGIAWDAANSRWILGGFNGPSIYAMKTGEKSFTPIATGPGGYDGVEVLPDGRVLVTSWADSSVHVLKGTTLTRMITGVPKPADIGVDPARMLIAIPLFEKNRVEVYKIPAN